MSSRLKKKHFYGVIILILLGGGLQNIPGTYTLEEIEERYEADTPEGRALLSLGRIKLDARLYFKEPALHRISRNAELRVPADTWLTLNGEMVPETENGETVLRPSRLDLRSDRHLTFIYRRVTVARARRLRINAKGELQATGFYQVLSALRTANRYERQREVRRDYRIPALASVNLSADVKELEPVVNSLLGDLIPDSFDIGSVFRVTLDRFHHFQFTDNHLDLHVDGTLRSAQSERMSNVFHPGFHARLGVDVHLPRDRPLSDAEIGASLKQIHSLDFNRSNPVFDKAVRDLARSYRDKARVMLNIRDEVPEISQWPGELFIEEFTLYGNAGDVPQLKLGLLWEETP